MANIDLFQGLTAADQSKQLATVKDLDNAINYLWQIVVSEYHNYPSWFLKFGSPMKFPNGKYGFVVSGSAGLHLRSEPKPLDNRTSMRYPDVPLYRVEFGEIVRIVCPLTIYKDRDQVRMLNPEWYWAAMLKAKSVALPSYLKWIAHCVFKGKDANQSKMPLLDDYVKKYIDPADGSNNGIPFCLSNGWGSTNLSEVITKTKVTEHALKKKFEAINSELVKDQKKVEADKATAPFKNKQWVKDNLNEDTQKFLAVLIKCRSEIRQVLKRGFDSKYRVKAATLEGFSKPVQAKDLILMLPSDSWEEFEEDFYYTTPGTDRITINSFYGVEVQFCDYMDKNTAYLIERDMIQFWILPELSKNRVEPYGEGTVDYISEFGHSVDMIDIYHNIYIKHK